MKTEGLLPGTAATAGRQLDLWARRAPAHSNEAIFQRLGMPAVQSRTLVHEVDQVLANFERLTGGLHLTAVFHERNPWRRTKSIMVVPRNHLIHIALNLPSAEDQSGRWPPVLCYFLADTLNSKSWHNMKLRVDGSREIALDRFLASGAPSDPISKKYFSHYFTMRSREVVMGRLHNELSLGCRHAAREASAFQTGFLLDGEIREVSNARLSRLEKGWDPVQAMTSDALSRAAFLATMTRRAGHPDLAQELEGSKIADLRRQLAFFQLSLHPRLAVLADFPYETTAHLVRCQLENLRAYQGFCQAFEYWYDQIRVVNAHN